MRRQSPFHLFTAALAFLLVLLLSVVKLCPCTENSCAPDGACAPVSTVQCACSHHGDDSPAEQGNEHEHSCQHESMALASAISLVKLPVAVLTDFVIATLIQDISLNHEALALISESLDPPPLLRSPFVAELKPLLI